ncbi:hypothetical protein [Streptomyces sp. NPDC085596]|uniref:hypothetical protein n=1 Tax=Streptomyces sp. NPDC085596 TaxID=3365731 RepID=UPI0037CF8B79
MDLSFWTVAYYSRSWERALRELEASENSISCLISSITDPEAADFIFCWPIYREGEAVHVQNSIIFLDGLEPGRPSWLARALIAGRPGL